MGVIFDNNDKIQTMDEMLSKNMIPCHYCFTYMSVCEVFTHTIHCEIRNRRPCETYDQLCIEIAMLILNHNIINDREKQVEFLISKGINFRLRMDRKIAFALYGLINDIKISKCISLDLLTPSKIDNPITRVLPNYILYYFFNNLQQIYCESPGIIFDIYDKVEENYSHINETKSLPWHLYRFYCPKCDGMDVQLDSNNANFGNF